MGRVLIVDDELSNRELLRRFLEKRDWQVDEADDGAAAVARDDVEQMDVVLLDITMPKLDGLSVLRDWRQRGVTTPIIMLTAVGQTETVVSALLGGANDFVSKPFSLLQLEERMHRVLEAVAQPEILAEEPVEPFPVVDSNDPSAIKLPEPSDPAAPSSASNWLAWRGVGPGSILGGRYRLITKLGEGSCGAVWRARHIDLDLDVAIKVLHKDGPTIGTDRVQAFRTEGMLAARIHHQHVLRVQDFGAHGGHLYLVTELLRGVSLEQHINQLNWVQATGLVSDVLDALACMHRHDIIHRDIKASNIFLHRRADERVEAKVIDFGVATTIAEASLSVVGTISHMAPECINRQGGKPADVFAAGVMWYNLLTHRLPFGDARPSAVAAIPAAIDEMMERLLHPVAAQRPTAAEAAALLRSYIRAPTGTR
jgi:CheY-like chemotaxis protein